MGDELDIWKGKLNEIKKICSNSEPDESIENKLAKFVGGTIRTSQKFKNPEDIKKMLLISLDVVAENGFYRKFWVDSDRLHELAGALYQALSDVEESLGNKEQAMKYLDKVMSLMNEEEEAEEAEEAEGEENDNEENEENDEENGEEENENASDNGSGSEKGTPPSSSPSTSRTNEPDEKTPPQPPPAPAKIAPPAPKPQPQQQQQPLPKPMADPKSPKGEQLNIYSPSSKAVQPSPNSLFSRVKRPASSDTEFLSKSQSIKAEISNMKLKPAGDSSDSEDSSSKAKPIGRQETEIASSSMDLSDTKKRIRQRRRTQTQIDIDEIVDETQTTTKPESKTVKIDDNSAIEKPLKNDSLVISNKAQGSRATKDLQLIDLSFKELKLKKAKIEQSESPQPALTNGLIRKVEEFVERCNQLATQYLTSDPQLASDFLSKAELVVDGQGEFKAYWSSEGVRLTHFRNTKRNISSLPVQSRRDSSASQVLDGKYGKRDLSKDTQVVELSIKALRLRLSKAQSIGPDLQQKGEELVTRCIEFGKYYAKYDSLIARQFVEQGQSILWTQGEFINIWINPGLRDRLEEQLDDLLTDLP